MGGSRAADRGGGVLTTGEGQTTSGAALRMNEKEIYTEKNNSQL